jgi:hypothetical protein
MIVLTDREKEIWGKIALTMLIVAFVNLGCAILHIITGFAPRFFFVFSGAVVVIGSLPPIQKRVAKLLTHIIDRKKKMREEIDF